MSNPETAGDPGPLRRRNRRLYTLGACLVVAVPVVALLAQAGEHVRDAADRTQ